MQTHPGQGETQIPIVQFTGLVNRGQCYFLGNNCTSKTIKTEVKIKCIIVELCTYILITNIRERWILIRLCKHFLSLLLALEMLFISFCDPCLPLSSGGGRVSFG